MRRTTIRTGWLVIALLAAGCSTAGPSGPATTGPASTPTDLPASAGTPVVTAAPAPSIPVPPVRALLFDTDVAGDDLVALAFLVASPNVDLVGITVSGTGEAHCAGGVDVVLRLLERLDAPDIPVACGRETPLQGTHTFPDAWREHVDGGSGLDLPSTDRTPSSSTAVELITRLSIEHAGLHVLATGPQTNLAEALLTDPDLAERLGPVFVMGGALHVPGNLVCCGAPEDNDVAEWNIYVDPHAANVVVGSGVMPSFVSLDGTNQVPLSKPFGQLVIDSAESAAARLVAELFTANPFMVDGTFYLWDPLAAQLAAGYPIGSFEPACIEVEEAEGPESGFTRPGCDTPNIQYLATVDRVAAEDTLLSVLNGG
jgi:pyrimidine-specific ribonucleoside hydrolase